MIVDRPDSAASRHNPRMRAIPAPGRNALFLSAVGLLLGCAIALGQETRNGVIRGTTEDSSGRPIHGVTVTLRDSEDQTLATIQSDENGSFEFARLASARFAVTAWRAGYGRAVYGANEPGAPAQLIDLSATKPEARIRIPMWKNASISGRVVDRSGDPVVAAQVEAVRLEVRGGLKRFVSNRIARTDDRGQYRLSDLAPGTYATILLSPNTSDVAIHYSTTYFPNVMSADAALLMPLAREEERPGIDFVVDLASSFSVSGIIEGVPVDLRTPLRVSLRPREVSGLGELISPRTSPLDPQGRFKFDGVVPGNYVAEVIDARLDPNQGGLRSMMFFWPPAADFEKTLRAVEQMALIRGVRSSSTDSTTSAQPLADPPRMRWARLNITVDDRNVDGLVGRFESGATISGKVVFAGESPKPSAETLAATPVFPSAVAFPVEAMGSGMGEDGTFRTVGVTPGRYQVLVIARFPGWTLTSVSQDGRDLPAGLVDVDRADVKGLVFTYTDRSSTLRGIVSDATGKPVNNAMVYIFPSDPDRWAAGSMLTAGTFRQARTTGDGRFSVVMPPGRYAVSATTSYVPDWKAIENLEGLLRRSERVRVGAGETATADLKVVK